MALGTEGKQLLPKTKGEINQGGEQGQGWGGGGRWYADKEKIGPGRESSRMNASVKVMPSGSDLEQDTKTSMVELTMMREKYPHTQISLGSPKRKTGGVWGKKVLKVGRGNSKNRSAKSPKGNQDRGWKGKLFGSAGKIRQRK